MKLRQFHLPRFASIYSAANEYQHWWEGTCGGLASCPGESVQLHSKDGHKSPLHFLLLTACQLLRCFICLFTWQRKGDLWVPASSEAMLAFEKTPVSQSRACSTPVFSRRLPWKWIRLRPSAPSWSEMRRVAQYHSVVHKKATCVWLRLPVAASCSWAPERKGDMWPA